VEIQLDAHVPPELVPLGAVEGDGSVLRMRGSNPTGLLTHALAAIAATGREVVSVDVVRPSLENVYLEITGRRFGPRPAAEEAS
jgi:hypothetical protein